MSDGIMSHRDSVISGNGKAGRQESIYVKPDEEQL